MDKEDKLNRYGEGPWIEEPDRLEWQAHGLPCLIQRHDHLGFLCGYVGVPPGHPFHGESIDVIDEQIDVHGGVTYAQLGNEVVGYAKQPDTYWIGFDCAHSFDVVPKSKVQNRVSDTYRSISYVRSECVELANQLATIAKTKKETIDETK